MVGVGAARAARRELAGRRFAQPEPAVGCQVLVALSCLVLRSASPVLWLLNFGQAVPYERVWWSGRSLDYV